MCTRYRSIDCPHECFSCPGTSTQACTHSCFFCKAEEAVYGAPGEPKQVNYINPESLSAELGTENTPADIEGEIADFDFVALKILAEDCNIYGCLYCAFAAFVDGAGGPVASFSSQTPEAKAKRSKIASFIIRVLENPANIEKLLAITSPRGYELQEEMIYRILNIFSDWDPHENDWIVKKEWKL